MNSSEYWIYSEENAGPAILAKCQGTAYLVVVTTHFKSLLLLLFLIGSVNVDIGSTKVGLMSTTLPT